MWPEVPLFIVAAFVIISSGLSLADRKPNLASPGRSCSLWQPLGRRGWQVRNGKWQLRLRA